MAYNYGYKSPGTSLNGIMKYLSETHSDFYKTIKMWGDLNVHLKQIRLSQEPNKPTSKSVESNSEYISKNYDFKVVRDYFGSIGDGCR